jgi:glucose/arabinose dehydrogenase
MKSTEKKPGPILLIPLILASLVSAGRAQSARAASLPPSLQFAPIVQGLTQPVFITNAGDGSNRLFIVQQTGQIRLFKNGSLLPAPFLDISGLVADFTGGSGEQGLLSLAFAPDFAASREFYILYTTSTGDPTFPYASTLARYNASGPNPDLADTASGEVLLSIWKKYTNHNGGTLAFGPDGYLYWSMGDGGSGGDPDNQSVLRQP